MTSLLIANDLVLSEGPDLTRYALVCGLLVLGIIGLGFALKRVANGTLKARARNRSLEVVDVLPISAKQRLAVVRCYDRCFLVGLGDKGINPVAELDAEEVLSPSPNPLVAAAARNAHLTPSPAAQPYQAPEPVVRPLRSDVVRPMANPPAPEAPVVRPLILDRGDAIEEEVVGQTERSPFRDLLAAEGISSRPKQLRRGGLIA